MRRQSGEMRLVHGVPGAKVVLCKQAAHAGARRDHSLILRPSRPCGYNMRQYICFR